MQTPIRHLKDIVRQKSAPGYPKGELWLGTRLFTDTGIEDTLENHAVLARRLNHALVSLSVAQKGRIMPELGYHYFHAEDIHTAVLNFDLPVFAVVDGPFQQLVNSMGLMDVLTGWVTERDEVNTAYQMEAEKTCALISEILEQPPAAVVIADDMAFDKGPFINPDDMNTLCSPFYDRAVHQVHDKGLPVFLHSCGKIDRLVPAIKSWEIDGFAAIQSPLNDLTGLYRQFDEAIVFLGGIECGLLEKEQVSQAELGDLKALVTELAPGGNIIFGSSSGLYKPEYMSRIDKIYAVIDRSAL